jgi:hypothetical protein
MNKFIIIIIIIIIIIVFISKSRKTTKASANTKPPEKKSGKGSDQPGSVGQGNQLGSVGQGNQLGSVGQGNQLGSVGQDDQLGSVGQGNQLGSVGQGNQLGSVGQGNQLGSVGQDDQPESAQPTGISMPNGMSPQYPYKSASVTKLVKKYAPLLQPYDQEPETYKGPVIDYEEGEPTLPPFYSNLSKQWYLNGVEIPPPRSQYDNENLVPDAPPPYNTWQDPQDPGYVFGGTSDKTRPGYDPNQDRANPNGALFDPYFSNPID